MQPQQNRGFMSKALFAALLAGGLIAAPLPALTRTATAQTTAAPEKKRTKTKRPLMPGQLVARQRLMKCGAEWRGAKAAGKTEKGMKWPKYWSACNKRLKAGG